MITIAAMRAASIAEAQARKFAEHIGRACERFEIHTPQRIAGFLAQASHESAGLTRMEENLFYTTPARIRAVWPSRFKTDAEAALFTRNPARLANRVYANRLGNGDEMSGEGWKFLGRGIFQLTGRANYMAAGDALGVDYKARPELVLLPEHAAATAGWFWSKAGCNELADAGKQKAICRRINGGYNGLHERLEIYRNVCNAFGIAPEEKD